MTGRLRDHEFQRVYEASKADLIREFYVPAMMLAVNYDRAVGYFRSSIFHLVQLAVSNFILRGGKMRLICSTSLDDVDEAVVRSAHVDPKKVDKAMSSDIRDALRDPTSLPVVELLATIVQTGQLDIRVAYKADERGIFHTKVGIFEDAYGDAVSFEGSPNETFMAWSHNEERFKTFKSWLPGGSEQVDDDQVYFNELWEGKRPSILVRKLPDVAKADLERHANPDPQAAIEKVRTLARSLLVKKRAPKRLQDHQLDVLNAWRINNSGIIDHVTGGGKTITALACVREWFASVWHGSVLIFVPSILLAKQWEKEIRLELESLNPRILQVTSESSQSWPEYLRDFLRPADSHRPRIVIATMDTGAKQIFLDRAAVGSTTLVVVDEVHRIGSPSRRKILDLEPGGRLGLSATPDRYRDPEGTNAIYDFFGNVLKPSFGIADAQRTIPPRLVEYTYHVGAVALEPDEAEEYRRLTKRIGMLINQELDRTYDNTSNNLHHVLIKRARILKNASAKVDYGVTYLSQRFESGNRWLVYCDSTTQVDSISEGLEKLALPVTRYLASMDSSKVETLERFEHLGGILLSIRCLDEGIDIPTVSHALILASSLNPREYLQRRGRVLRSSPGKVKAEIHDTLVGVKNSDDKISVFNNEIERAKIFASDAQNERHVLWKIDELNVESSTEWVNIESEEVKAR